MKVKRIEIDSFSSIKASWSAFWYMFKRSLRSLFDFQRPISDDLPGFYIVILGVAIYIHLKE